MPLKRKKRGIRLKKAKLSQLKKYARSHHLCRPGIVAIAGVSAIVVAMVIGTGLQARRGDGATTQAFDAAPPDESSTSAANPTATVLPAAAPAPTVLVAPKRATMSITGCLERNNETFRLRDTDGVNAPKARSWKSGFLRKTPASVAVADAATGLRLRDHVGERVSVTGIPGDHGLHVSSLRRVSASCDQNEKVKPTAAKV